MAATKHALGDGPAAAPPSKKTKIDACETLTKTEETKNKKEKRDKKEKKDKKDKKLRGNGNQTHDDNSDDDEEAQRKARKAARKARKAEKKQARTMKDDYKEEESQDSLNGDKPPKPSKEKNSKKKFKHEKTTTSRSPRYRQTISLSSLPQTEIDAFLSKHHIAVSDPRQTSLRPVMEFDHLPSTNLLEKSPSPMAGFKAPTPIQAAAWPYALSGRDVVGVAETGSGKTLAFALPCVEALSDDGQAARKATRAIVVSPTRELAMQTHVQLARLASLVGLGCVCIYGGASKDEQRAQLKRGCDVIVATPGRLKDFMSDGTVQLGRVRFVVLDEADRMLDRGFEDDIKHILGSCPAREQRQTLMFTATWPQSVQALASTFMVEPVKITVGTSATAVAGSSSETGVVELQANPRITQRVEVVDPQDKETRLLQILRQHQQGKHKNDRILVFCLYKKEATRVEGMLSRKGIRVGGIHGDLRQEQRTRSLEAFKSGATPVLVATDVAARGLDIPEVKLVINVTFPLTAEDYVHRIGRTGRAGNSGEAITLFTVHDKTHSGSLINILKGANQPVPDELLKFGTTVKKKTHDMYGSFFKDVDMTQKATKITFD
ncbi:ATP-dependent RNA helicase DBP3 [Ophiocordyceps camponoti-floridani]|uniref:RNA helicase n=1 Tax=Ophiocordyceps camponoti-floridani TaxID=2030778 RepID=A0A8H4QAM7_9HYPO|nr:ATP-dependent RNA helicase DBP3 [Ophiocordyceps camponoti-floridani]